MHSDLRDLEKDIWEALCFENLSPDQLQKAIDFGVSVNSVCPPGMWLSGHRFAHIATAMGDLGLLETALKNGADLTLADDDGRLPLVMARFSEMGAGVVECVELLLKQPDTNMDQMLGYKGEDDWTLLMVMVKELASNRPDQENRLKIVKLLVEHGADTSLKNANGQTAIDIAQEEGLDDIVKILKTGKNKIVEAKKQIAETQRQENLEKLRNGAPAKSPKRRPKP